MTFNILVMLLLLPLVQGVKMSENDDLYEKCARGELSTEFFEQAMTSDLVAAVFLASLSPPKRSAATETSAVLISNIKMPKQCPYDIMALILKADADEDGKLSAIEQITLAIEVLKTVVDKDRNGCVSEKEVENYAQKCVKRSEEYAGND